MSETDTEVDLSEWSTIDVADNSDDSSSSKVEFEIEEKEGDAAHFLKVNYITSIQMEHVLLQEIKKQEPYFEEEKRKIRLQLTPDETSQEFPAFLI